MYLRGVGKVVCWGTGVTSIKIIWNNNKHALLRQWTLIFDNWLLFKIVVRNPMEIRIPIDKKYSPCLNNTCVKYLHISKCVISDYEE